MDKNEKSCIKHVSFESLKIHQELLKSFRKPMKEIIFSKVAALQFATSIKNELLHMYFFTNSAKFLTPKVLFSYITEIFLSHL